MTSSNAAKPRCPSAEFGAAVAISGGTAMIGSRTAPNGGAVCIFAKSGKTWRLQAVLGDPHPGKWDEFGSVVEASTTSAGMYALVEAWGRANNNPDLQPDGPVYVYRRSGSSWKLTQTLQDPLGYHPGNWFGGAIAMSGTSAVITALGTSNFKGAAYVYALSGHTWKLQGSLKNPGTSDFGGLAAMSGSTAVIGDGGLPSPPGATPRTSIRPSSLPPYPDAFVFVRSRSGWRYQAHVAVHSNDSEQNIAVSGNVILLGGTYVEGFGGTNPNADRGHVYVLERAGGIWREVQVISDPGKSHGDFGTGLAIAGGIALASAPNDNCGVAYAFKWTGKKFTLRAKLLPPGASKCSLGTEGFGYALAVSGTTAIIGAPGNGKTYVLNIP